MKAPMLEALGRKKAGGLDIHIIIEDPSESMATEDTVEGAAVESLEDGDNEQTQELGLAPPGVKEGSELPANQPHADEAVDRELIAKELEEAGLAMGKKRLKKG